MKQDIHPDYKPVIFYDVSADYKVLTKSTVTPKETMEWEDGKEYPVIRFDLSSASHAFYTGKEQQLMDKGGRIEQFRNRYGAQQEAAKQAAAQKAAAAVAAPEPAAAASEVPAPAVESVEPAATETSDS